MTTNDSVNINVADYCNKTVSPYYSVGNIKKCSHIEEPNTRHNNVEKPDKSNCEDDPRSCDQNLVRHVILKG